MKTEERIRLLLIEDDDVSGEAMIDMLNRRNVDVTHFASAEAGLKAVRESTFDAAVADIRLGEMSGVEFLAEVRKQDRQFPVILLTGFDSLDSAIQAVRLGAQDYILKPLEGIDDLLVPVKNAIAARKLQIENDNLTTRLRSLASELVLVEERERQRIAAGLHDTVGQQLVGLTMQVELALKGSDSEQNTAFFTGLRDSLRGLVQQTRSLIFQICPTSLHDLTLAAAIDQYLSKTGEQYRVETAFCDSTGTLTLGEDLNILLYRSTRELIFNAIKHAQAATISVHTKTEGNSITISVQDDGVGFDTSADKEESKQGFGLLSIRQHIRNVGGTLSILSEPGKGTTATLTAPCESETE